MPLQWTWIESYYKLIKDVKHAHPTALKLLKTPMLDSLLVEPLD
jgi:hypothetical protein